MPMTTSVADLLQDTVETTFTRTNLIILAIGAVGAILSYQAGKRAGEWLYERHLKDRLGDKQ